ncbi:MAG: restriction endonuclease subunit S, partial [Ruminococcus sp.]|nr:restriction endonuclease subunit S [Ruminococcus sp.]
MSEWKECTIADIGEVVGGATPSTKKSENYKNGNISWITPKDLSDFSGRYIYYGERNITETGLNSCSTHLLPENSILFSSRAPIGYIAIAGKKLCTNQGFKSIVPNENIDFMFLYYLLKFNKEKIEHMGNGTTFKEVSGKVMKEIKINIPVDISEQKQIASILSALDDKIELNNKINKNLEEQAQAIFKSWFVDFELFGGVMPDNWRITTLGETTSKFATGLNPRKNFVLGQ